MRQGTDAQLDAQSQQNRTQQCSTGSMIDVGVHPISPNSSSIRLPAHLQQYADGYTSVALNWQRSGE